jgi:hypothetical protein
MNSGMIGKVAKAHRYAEEPDRFRFTQLEVAVHGDNSEHAVTLEEDRWRCNCEFFERNATCAHTMALELLLGGMVPQGRQFAVA